MNDFTIKSHYGTGKTVQWDLLGNFLQTHTETYINVNMDGSEKQKSYNRDDETWNAVSMKAKDAVS